MSDFAQLKARRKDKESKSHVQVLGRSDELEASSASTAVSPQKASHPDIGHLYRTKPQTLEIRNDHNRGRGLFNMAPRRPGDIILSVKPHVAVLSNDKLDSHCSNCFGSGKALRRCTACKLIFYCDSACQTKDWLLHKQECLAIQRWTTPEAESSSIAGDAIRCLARMVWRKQKLGKDSNWTQEIDLMQSHRISLRDDPDSQESQIYTQLAHSLVRFLGMKSPQEMAGYGFESPANLVDLVSRFTTNTFTITSPELTPLGACVSPLVALINHSCDPNAVVVFPRGGVKDEEPLMQVTAIKDISSGEEILTAYIDTTLPRDVRRKQLNETYHFTCNCQLCNPIQTIHSLDLREAMFCPKKCGGICPLPSEDDNVIRCNTCNTVVKDTDAVLDAIRVGQEGLDKATVLQFSKPQKAVQLTTNLVPILTSVGLVPSTHPLLGLSRLLASLLIEHLPSHDLNFEEIQSPMIQPTEADEHKRLSPEDIQEALDETIRATTRSSTGMNQILCPGHPMRGIAQAELGKLLCVDESCPKAYTQALRPSIYPPSGQERLRLAYDTLMRARSELLVGFGRSNEGGDVGKAVRKLMVDVEKEMAVWKQGVTNAIRDAKLAKTD